MNKKELENWARENGRALPQKKSSGKWGMHRSTLLNRETFEESYSALREWAKEKLSFTLQYPELK